MKLLSLSLQPIELFSAVEFDSGCNFIYGVRDLQGDSLNGIGKSLFLDFLDFGLLGYFNPKHNSRLARAYNKSLLKNSSVNLEFQVGQTKYNIVRSFNNYNYPSLFSSKVNHQEKYIRELQDILFEIIFARPSYSGFTDNNWYSKLIQLYLKIQKVSDERFINPVKFTKGSTLEMVIYHLFLLNIDNTIFHQYSELLSNISSFGKSRETTKQFLFENHNIENITAAHNTLNNLQNKIRKHQKAIDNYTLSEQYDSLSEKADEITSKIKSLMLKNSYDRKKILEFEQFSTQKVNFSSNRVESIYNEISPELGAFVKRSLDEAKSFRNAVVQSRENFVNTQKTILTERIKKREREIETLEKEQSQIISSLSSRNAFTDIKDSYEHITVLNSQKSTLESQLSLYQDLVRKEDKLKNSISFKKNEIDDYIKSIEGEVKEFSSLMSDIYQSVFQTIGESPAFTISNDDKPELNILPDDIYSHGLNQGRTLVYDLAILFNSIEKNLNSPRFLVHDGIFDSLDNTHLLYLYKYCNEKLNPDFEFQYIVTLNQIEDGNEDDILNHKKVYDLAKLRLSQNNKLLGQKF